MKEIHKVTSFLQFPVAVRVRDALKTGDVMIIRITEERNISLR